MRKYRLKKTFDGYVIQRKVFFIWIDSVFDYDGEPRYHTYKAAKEKIRSLLELEEFDERIKKIKKEKNNIRKKFVPTYIYPPLPEEEP